MYQLILTLHVIIALAIVTLVLIQHGKGADIGAAFGSGASGTVFGSQGTGSFLFKLTGGLALTFFMTSLLLSSIIASHDRKAAHLVVPQSSVPIKNNTVPIPVDEQ